MSNFKMPAPDFFLDQGAEKCFYESTLHKALRDVLEQAALACDKRADVLEPLHPEGIATDYFQGGIKSASRRCAAKIRAMIKEIK